MNIPQEGQGEVGSEIDRQLDVRGQDCPLPALATRRCLDDMASGQVLEILATDPLAEVDLQILCDRFGHEWLTVSERSGALAIRIRVSESRRAGAG
ncbi:MAG: sulfurtransferase TusA family protein [Wenzhouxiangella sp.]|jgi:tRNA 2-thiouridine synthesizing protein A|nr:sulfurtransferase TusA family protein [Wenzhouxiangella sp.]